MFVPNCWSPGLALSRAFGDTREAEQRGVVALPRALTYYSPPRLSAGKRQALPAQPAGRFPPRRSRLLALPASSPERLRHACQLHAPSSPRPGHATHPSAVASTVGVTSKPEVTVLPLPPAGGGDSELAGVSNAAAASCCSSYCDGAAPAAPAAERHVLIVASDGLWEWVSNTTAVAIASAAATGERPGGCCHPRRWLCWRASTAWVAALARLGRRCRYRCSPLSLYA